MFGTVSLLLLMAMLTDSKDPLTGNPYMITFLLSMENPLLKESFMDKHQQQNMKI